MLTVIIPTIEERKLLFERQCDIIKSYDPNIIILSDDDPEKTIGRKRGELLEKVDTEYVMHIDDDDILDSSIFYEIKLKLKNSPDAVAFKEAQYHNGVFKRIASLGCRDGTPKEMGIVHRNPVKTSLAQQVGFYDLNEREDTVFGLELSFLLKDVSVVNKILYHYLDNKNVNRNKRFFLEYKGDPEDMCPRKMNLFNWDKYGKIL